MTSAYILVDTNVLLRIVHLETAADQVMLRNVQRYTAQGTTLCITLQNLAEFWNVATRSVKHNGFGRTVPEVARQTDSIAARFKILTETEETVTRWRTLVESFSVTGVLVHDTRVAAIMLEYQIKNILTLNPKDFTRFPFIQTIDPREAN